MRCGKASAASAQLKRRRAIAASGCYRRVLGASRESELSTSSPSVNLHLNGVRNSRKTNNKMDPALANVLSLGIRSGVDDTLAEVRQQGAAVAEFHTTAEKDLAEIKAGVEALDAKLSGVDVGEQLSALDARSGANAVAVAAAVTASLEAVREEVVHARKDMSKLSDEQAAVRKELVVTAQLRCGLCRSVGIDDGAMLTKRFPEPGLRAGLREPQAGGDCEPGPPRGQVRPSTNT